MLTMRVEHPDRPSAHCRIDFLSQDHIRGARLCSGKSTREKLCGDKAALMSGQRAQPRKDRIANYRVEQQAPTPKGISHRRDQKRDDVAQPDHREHRAQIGLGDA